MMPSEFWQATPHDIFGFIAKHRPPIMRGNMTKKEFDRAVERLKKLEAKLNG